MNHDTYVIIPVYNEAKMVGSVIETVKKHYANVVCVSDGSRDNSSDVIVTAGAYLVEHPINFGAGAATQTGVDFALLDPKAKYFVTIDADGQHDVNDTLAMVALLRKGKYDVVFGSRFMGKVENISHFKFKFLQLATVFSKKTSGVNLSDPHIGLRAFNRTFAENLKITLHDFAHASEIIHRIDDGNYRYTELPASVSYSDYSKSKGQSWINAINITFDLWLHRMSKK